ncbi:MAG: branched-chain amino acid transport system II carrier protein [Flavobacteriaceae bacterium]|nr:branched-chain amino acid transport system II carrier protein [Flavobacteriaceae bacterium]
MSIRKTLVISFAMFSMIFGGGNFILPPLLGINAADSWTIVAVAFGVSGVVIPLLGIFVQAKIQGTMIDIGKKIHPIFGLVMGVLMYGVCLSFPIPRTASVTYELAIVPYFSISSLGFSIVYFSLVFYLCFNRGKILDILGKYLTPILLVIILLIIFKAVFFVEGTPVKTTLENPFKEGLLEGYQTFDGIASIIIGGVIITSLGLDKELSFQQRKRLTVISGIISGVALFTIYMGFIYTGAILGDKFASSQSVSRTEVLSVISYHTLGNIGKTLLNISVSIACFTTAVGVITGAADFMKTIFKHSAWAYKITVFVSCLLGVVVGQTGTDNIIKIAVPILVVIYPIVMMLIFLNLASENWTSPLIFKSVVLTSFLFSIPNFMASVGITELDFSAHLPLSSYGLAWLLPSFIVWGLVFLIKKTK